MTEYSDYELRLRSRLLRNVIVVLIAILLANFSLGIIRHNAIVKLVTEGFCIALLIVAISPYGRSRYELSSRGVVLATFIFVFVTRLTDGFPGTYILSQNALAMCIIFFVASVFVRSRAWLVFIGVCVCATYFGFLAVILVTGQLGPNIMPLLPIVSTPVLLLLTTVVLGTAIARIFEKTSNELRAKVHEVERGREELSRLNTKLEEQVYERSLQLIEKSRHEVLDSMVAGLSHQLNTPLGSAMTATSFIKAKLKEQATNPEGQRIFDAAELLERNLQRAIDLMASYRELGTFASEDPTVYTTLGPFFTHVRNNVESLLQGHHVNVAYEYDERLGLQVPMSHLHYIIIELVHNARIHAEHEGQKILIASHADEGYLRLSVYNTGTAVTEDIRKRALDPFFTTAGKDGRLGIGLAKVNTIVRDILHGSVTVLEPGDEWAFGVSIRIPGAHERKSG